MACNGMNFRTTRHNTGVASSKAYRLRSRTAFSQSPCRTAMEILIPIGAGLLLATLYCAIVQKLPVAWTILKIELTLILGVAAYCAAQAYF